MSRWSGDVGYIIEVTTNGVTRYVPEEHHYRGDLLDEKSTPVTTQSDSTIDEIGISNRVSFVADRFAYTHSDNIRYASLDGVRWRVSNIKVARPRIILTLGGVYRGETPQTGPSAEA